MEVAVLGDRTSVLPAGWERETVVSVFGDAQIDATAEARETGASLTVVGIFGDAHVRVPVRSRVRESGFRLAGDRRLEVTPGTGPEIRVSAYCLFGDLTITDRAE